MPRPNALVHDMAAELRYQLYQTVVEIQRSLGSWDAVILTEQAETLARFMDHPHAVGSHE